MLTPAPPSPAAAPGSTYRWYLDTDLYDHLKDLTVPMVHTDTLGEAFEPSQKFENPDGTPIAFDHDYFGQRRGSTILPVPFTDAPSAGKAL